MYRRADEVVLTRHEHLSSESSSSMYNENLSPSCGENLLPLREHLTAVSVFIVALTDRKTLQATDGKLRKEESMPFQVLFVRPRALASYCR